MWTFSETGAKSVNIDRGQMITTDLFSLPRLVIKDPFLMTGLKPVFLGYHSGGGLLFTVSLECRV